MRVSIRKAGFERKEIISGVKKILIDIEAFTEIKDGELILIKPNLTSDKPSIDSGIVTNTYVVEGVVAFLRESFPKSTLAVIESDSDGNIRRAFERLGYLELQKRYALELIRLDELSYYKLHLPEGKIRSIAIPEIILDANHLINIATLKRHVHERITCCWKNMWGIPSSLRERMEMHPFLPEALYALNTYLKPTFCVIDAIVGLQGPGPLDGRPVRLGRVLASKDMLALDWIAAKIIGENPNRMPELSFAKKKMHFDPKKIEIVGDGYTVKKFDFIPRKSFWFYRLGLKLRRLALYLNNFSMFLWLTGFALRSGSAGDYMGGGVMTFRGSLKMARDIAFRFEVSRKVYG